jgi:hypothetical protein
VVRVTRQGIGIQRQMDGRMDLPFHEVPDRLEVEETGVCQ